MAKTTIVAPKKADASQTQSKSKSGGKVTVACKLPHGLRLQSFRMEDFEQPVMGGGVKTGKIAVRDHEKGEVVLNGNRVAVGATPHCDLAGGFALTHNVDAEFFEHWLKANHDNPAVKNGLIFACDDPHFAADQAKEQASIKSGAEPLDMRKNDKGKPRDLRVPRGIEKADEQKEPA